MKVAHPATVRADVLQRRHGSERFFAIRQSHSQTVEKLCVTFPHARGSRFDNLPRIFCIGALAPALRERFDCVMLPFAYGAGPANDELMLRREANLPDAPRQRSAAFALEQDRVEPHS